MTMRFAATAVAAVSYTLLCLAPATASEPTYKIHWLLGHKNLDYFEEAAARFKQTVERESRGDIVVDIRAQVPDDALAGREQGSAAIAGQVARGEAEMGHSFTDVMGALDPRMHAFEAPYLFRGYRHLEGVFEGPLGAELLDGLRAHGLAGLSFTYSGGASGLATFDRELRRPEDLKGLKVGVFGDAVNAAWLETLGARAVPIGHALERIAPMAREGTLDAVVTTWRNFDREDLGTEFRQVGLLGSTYLVSVTYINAKFFDSLPAAYQTLLARASREAGRIERAQTIQLNASAQRGMTEDRGVQAVFQSAADRARFARALRPAYSRIERILGQDLVERIQSTPDAAESPSIPVEIARR